MRELCLTWIIGSVIFITSSHDIGQVYAGRFIIGLGLGQAGVVAPIYLAEIAPRRMRGMMVNVYGMSEYLGIVIGVGMLQFFDCHDSKLVDFFFA